MLYWFLRASTISVFSSHDSETPATWAVQPSATRPRLMKGLARLLGAALRLFRNFSFCHSSKQLNQMALSVSSFQSSTGDTHLFFFGHES